MRKSIKHLFGLTLGVSLALGLISSASAEGSVSVQVDGKTVQSAAYIDQNDRTMVSPDIADALGLTQKQEGSKSTVHPERRQHLFHRQRCHFFRL